MSLIRYSIIILLSLSLINCDSDLREQKLIVGVVVDNPPYEFLQDGQVIGLEIDLVNEIGKKLGKKILIKTYNFPELFSALISQNIDIAAGILITPERKLHVSFSQPYISSSVCALYRTTDNFKNINDLNNKIIGTQRISPWKIIADNLSEKINIKVNTLPDNLTLIKELKNKSIDAIIFEENNCKKLINTNPELSSFNLDEYEAEFAIAMSKNSGLIKNVDSAINSLQNDNTINRIIKKWLHSEY